MEERWLHRPTWVEVDLDSLAYNVEEIKRHIGENKEIMGIVKADAYGHGSVEVANVLIDQGVRYLAVSILDEAIVLRKAGITLPILILGYTPVEQFQDVIKWNIVQTVYNKDMIYSLYRAAEKNKKVGKVHIKVDTGMGRIGFRDKKELIEMIKEIQELEFLEIEGIFTHFSVADERDKEYTKKQLKQFTDIYQSIEKEGVNIPIKHTANSAAIIDMEESHLDLVRPGVILYGLYPSTEVLHEKVDLKPVMSFKTTISHIKTVPPETSISYGRKYITNREQTIATLPVGYADGYSRLLSGKAEVFVNGSKVPVIGNICMDQCMIDITNIPNAKVGDEVTLFGKGLRVEEIAEKLGTINYEIICMVSKRVPRVYIKDKKIAGIKNTLLDGQIGGLSKE